MCEEFWSSKQKESLRWTAAITLFVRTNRLYYEAWYGERTPEIWGGKEMARSHDAMRIRWTKHYKEAYESNEGLASLVQSSYQA